MTKERQSRFWSLVFADEERSRTVLAVAGIAGGILAVVVSLGARALL